ncbi:hypothetical protein LWI28_023372 [Acer negundo]|uniref:Late embryogenesis abundant protein LEA-2 subgroup domain-containing protein n=1 Tax=Acer negundo TaxID=4023 RepID=A0AAD5JAM1_ACENE|nr:hypothetical protein LWI28_023372 [Acer negundo]
MMLEKSDSDVTSLAPSSPRSPKRPVYYVQSPSRDSHDEDKSSTMQNTPSYNTPTESPSHPSYGRHSRESSSSRFSGTFRSSRGGRKRNDKGWPECNVIQEEGNYNEFYADGVYSRRCQLLIGLVAFVMLFSVFCLIIWGASRPYEARISVKSLTVHNFYFGEGSDFTGVPTKMLTVNCSMRMSVYNPATFFGIHVSSTSVNLMFSEITVATGQLKKYYQPRKSHRVVMVNLKGNKVPLYGAGGSLVASDMVGDGVPMVLVFEVKQRGNVVGKLVKSRHRRRVSCSLLIDSRNSKPIKFNQTSCTYR